VYDLNALILESLYTLKRGSASGLRRGRGREGGRGRGRWRGERLKAFGVEGLIREREGLEGLRGGGG
jgi:hypothetical protein